MKVEVAAFDQEKALVGAFSVIVQLHRLIDLRHYSRYRPHTAQLSAVPVHSVLRLLSVMLTSMITSQGLIGGM